MYIQRSPQPLAHFKRDIDDAPAPALEAFEALPTNGSPSQPKPHPTGYLVLAVVLSILLLSVVGVFTVRRRGGALLPCSRKKGSRKVQERHVPPRMQREGRSRFMSEFTVLPALTLKTDVGAGSGTGSSNASPSSPNSSSEGPLTPSFGEDHGHGDVGLSNTVKYDKDGNAFESIPIVVHTLTQTHQTYLAGSDMTLPNPERGSDAHRMRFSEATPSLTPNAIRPHGLPLSPVPEETSAVPTLPSIYFDERVLYHSHEQQ